MHSSRHREWRKVAKKIRRKRIRQKKAILRDQQIKEENEKKENSPSYQLWLAEKEKEDAFLAQEESRLAAEREQHWRRVEEEAQKQFQELQKKLAIAREERAKQNAKIKEEWEREQSRQKIIKEQQEIEYQRKVKEQEQLNKKVEDFLNNGGDTPEHLKTTLETNPNKPLCPFFQKTSACRFFDVCSRNHARPGISRIILIPNFFSHYSLEKTENENFSDSSLEFENHETYRQYREFFFDVAAELEKYGDIRLFKTCCNHEAHLRGNVYVEFSRTNEALKCYRSLNGRFYGGKQLGVEFCTIKSWKNAICGLHFMNRCPKGTSCNFLHVFRNPMNLYNDYMDDNFKERNRDESDLRNCRWSESPERLPTYHDEMKTSSSKSKRYKDHSSERSERRSSSRRSNHSRMSPHSRVYEKSDKSYSRKRDKSSSSRSSSRKTSKSRTPDRNRRSESRGS